ncbi:YbaK/EbsC family protein [bacterium]|nr:YbaK/EbsC family protein [bacterium]
MQKHLSSSAEKVQQALTELGVDCQVVEMPDSTRTAEDAAKAIGCSVAQIAKSLVFQGEESKTAILVIASGTNRVDEKKVSALVGEKIKRANPDFVREQTGFAIGGIPPVGHAHKLKTLIDQDLGQYLELWAAAGTPHGVFRLTMTELEKITTGTVCDLKLS